MLNFLCENLVCTVF